MDKELALYSKYHRPRLSLSNPQTCRSGGQSAPERQSRSRLCNLVPAAKPPLKVTICVAFLCVLAVGSAGGAPGKDPTASGAAATASTTGGAAAIPVPSTAMRCSFEGLFRADDNFTLSRSYSDGDWEAVTVALTHYTDLTCGDTVIPPTSWFSILFLNMAATPPALTRILFARPSAVRAMSDPFTTRLPAKTLYDVHLFAPPRPVVTSAYTASPTANPLIAAAGKALGTIAGGLGKVLTGQPAAGKAAGFEEHVEARYEVEVHVIALTALNGLLERATLSLADVAYLPSLLASVQAADSLRDTVKAVEVAARNTAAVIANDKLHDALCRCIDGQRTKPARANAAGDTAGEASSCVGDLLTVAQQLLQSEPEVGSEISRVFSLYAGLAAQAGAQVSPLNTTTQYAVAPLTHFVLGLGAGGLGRASLNQPAKIDASKNLVGDSPTGLLTFVAVDWHPSGYDETTVRPRCGELAKVVGGVTLTPNAGLLLGLGYNFPFLRSVGLVGGYSFLLANVLQRGDLLGMPPSAAHAGSPTRRGVVGAPFLALSYGLQ
jgi:hypothetical protein